MFHKAIHRKLKIEQHKPSLVMSCYLC